MVLRLTEPILELEFEKVERLEKELAAAKEANKNQQLTSQRQLEAKQTEIDQLKKELERYQRQYNK